MFAAALSMAAQAPPGSILSVAIDPGHGDEIYVSVAGLGVLQSRDGGSSWLPTGPGLPASENVLRLLVAGAPSVILASTQGALFRSLDRGGSWLRAGSGIDRSATVAGALRPGATFYASNGPHLYRSLDSAQTWFESDAGLPESGLTALAADPIRPGIAYAGAREGLFRTVDGGATWTRTALPEGLSSVHYVTSVAVDPNQPATVYAATLQCGFSCSFSDVKRSDDGGDSWSRLEGPTGLSGVSIDSTSTAYTATSAGFSRSPDRGVSWQPLAVLPAPMAAFAASPYSRLILGATTDGLLYASTDHGATWSALGPPRPACDGTGLTLCVGGRRFSLAAQFTSPVETGTGHPVWLTANTGAFWFFDSTNLELIVKVLDGRSVNGKFWVFYGSLTNVEFTLAVTDADTGAVKTYFNPQGHLVSVADTSAF
jgi:photosystem II stability/assembly factor-like uncharacterized protein